jgi:16S rRNA (guanine1207-N2)-methyltransferase
MAQSRLTTALEEGLLTVPAGAIAVMRPALGMDLGGLPRDQVRISHGFRPDVDYWQAAGYAVSANAAPADLAIVCVPRSKALAHAMIAEACSIAPVVVVDGQKTNGVDAIWKEVRARIGDVAGLTRAHGRLFMFPTSDRFGDWEAPPPVQGKAGFFLRPGVFSGEAVDRGSMLLATALPARLPSRMADLGAGWGYLARAVLARASVIRLDLIEAEKLALDCARLNVIDNRAFFHWEDATRFAPPAPFDGIVMNPPFHAGRAADPDLGRAFIAAAARMLTPSGQLWMVANRHLPYEAALDAAFRDHAEIGGDGGFKIIHAARPRDSRSAAKPAAARHAGTRPTVTRRR